MNIKKLWKKIDKEGTKRDNKFKKKYGKKRFVFMGISVYLALAISNLIIGFARLDNFWVEYFFYVVFFVVIYYKNIYDIAFLKKPKEDN